MRGGNSRKNAWLFRQVADSLDIMATQVKHKGAVIVRMEVGADAGRSVILAAGGQRRLVERIDRRPIRRGERDMDRPFDRLAGADPEERLLIRAEAQMRFSAGLLRRDLDQELDAQRRERLQIERLGFL